MDRMPKSGEFYRHFKDKLYQVITVAEHTETGEPMVVYQALYGDYRTYVRPLSMFAGEVDHEKYPEASQTYRFEKVIFEPQMSTENAHGSCGSASPEEADCLPKAPARELNPNLLLFIEAETCDQKLEYLAMMRGKIGQEEMDLICAAADLNEVSGDLESRMDAVKQYLLTRKRFEGRRLR